MRADRLAVLAAGAMLILAGVPAAAGGAGSGVALDVRGGGLSATGPELIELPPVRLRGRPVTVEAPAGAFQVVDTRGDAPGWTLVARAERLADPLGRPMGAPLELVPGDVPPGLAPAGAEAGTALDAPRALMRAAPGGGLGTHVVRPRLRLTVPADTPSGPYATTLVVTVA